MMSPHLQALVGFADTIMRATFEGDNLDPEEIQDFAAAAGIVRRTRYDPQQHGTAGLETCEPGDDWYEFAEWFRLLRAEVSK